MNTWKEEPIELPNLGVFQRSELIGVGRPQYVGELRTALGKCYTVFRDWDRYLDTESVIALIPRAQLVCEQMEALKLRATEAVISVFADDDSVEVNPDEFDASLEFSSETIIIHMVDKLGRFEEGYWPAVHFNPHFEVIKVSVES
ncbi:hypothetical protein [Corynebacterium freiburgense]|uniref:hypothetical protein n=1 Tax=Corynebacterium freiburgense TaxID=556548 RepID=UPI0012ECB23B|nr:hypothetical protein [Corynebacterium freiburgense]WJZ02604.1 hypothetical protein CFREI_06590 [Corynebacterium freiburgense]